MTNLAVGRYDISDGIFVKIQEYNTKDEKRVALKIIKPTLIFII
ncbi:hypothetical protein SDC49_04090 [Lactobacillus sp. R2/2]|nr:hypothetical protein [Lactobacillus sp. R2/2]